MRVAMLSVHTSPLAQPGGGDAGGMNVSIRALASALAAPGVMVDVLTRAEHPEQPPVVVVEPGFRVLHVEAGPRAPVPACAPSPSWSRRSATAARDVLERVRPDYACSTPTTGCRARSGHRLKHELDLPLVTTFHSLERVKAEVGLDDEVSLRPRVEAEVVRCADLVVAATDDERAQLVRLYGADPERIEIVPPGGRPHALRARRPGGRQARPRRGRAPGAPVRRSHPAAQGRRPRGAGPRRAARPPCGARRRRRPERARGRGASSPGCTTLVDELGLASRVRFVPPQPHEQLARYYQAADVCVVPSRSESFGLVALEAAACGTPVVASNVGRAPDRRRRRRHRPARRRPRRARIRRRDRAGRCTPSTRRCPSPRSGTRPGSAGASRPPACAGTTTISALARRCSAAETDHDLVRPRRRARPRRRPTWKGRLRPKSTSRSWSTTRSCSAGTCASRATPATPPPSTSTSISARCATRCTSCPSRRSTSRRCTRCCCARTTRCTARASRSDPTATSTSSAAWRSST